MGIVVLPGGHKFADPSTSRGAGNISLHSPTRGLLDYQSTLAEVAVVGGTGIREGIPGIIYTLTGIDVSSWSAFLDSLADGTGIDLPLIKAALELLEALVDSISQAIVDAWNGVETVAEGIAADVWGAITGIRVSAEDAATAAANANRAINELKAQINAGSGAYFTDPLDYANAPSLPSPWIVYNDGAGAGTYGPNGTDLIWKPSGYGYRLHAYRHPSYLSTLGKFVTAAVMPTRTTSDSARAYLGGVNAAGDGLAIGIGNNSLTVCGVTAGVPTAVAEGSTPIANGDTYEVYYGSTANPDYFECRRNGTKVIWTEPGTGIADEGIIMTGPDFYPYAGGAATPGLFFTQEQPGRMGSLIFADNNL